MNFSQFVGNEKAKEQIEYFLTTRRIAHAIIIEGEDGLGKRTLARLIAQAAFCRGDGEKPCCECPQCKKAMQGIHPDIYEYSASGAPKSFHIDKVRAVIKDAYISPNEADYKFFILGNCHGMNAESQNAILKILEEPPEYVVFILTVKSKSMLLPTVLSRARVISLKGVEPEQGANYISSIADTDYKSALSAMKEWNGNIGKALEAFGSGKAAEVAEYAEKLCEALVQDNEFLFLAECARFEKDRQLLSDVMYYFKIILRDALLAGSTKFISGSAESAESLALKYSKQKLASLMETADNIIAMAKKNANGPLLITKMSCDFKRAVGR